MSEAKTVSNTESPRTRNTLRKDLRRVGIQPGQSLLVHCSLSKIGWIAGGAQALIEALLDAVGPEGTLVFPSFTAGLTDPACWECPPVPKSWWPVIREEMTPFNPATTPCRGMGQVAELFRTWPGAKRSYHPQNSFAALGAKAEDYTRTHHLREAMGVRSPLGALYEDGAKVLLLGVGYRNCTSFHLSEALCPDFPKESEAGPILKAGKRHWVQFERPAHDASCFPSIGEDFEKSFAVPLGRVGSAPTRLLSMPQLVDFGVQWFQNRNNTGESASD